MVVHFSVSETRSSNISASEMEHVSGCSACSSQAPGMEFYDDEGKTGSLRKRISGAWQKRSNSFKNGIRSLLKKPYTSLRPDPAREGAIKKSFQKFEAEATFSSETSLDIQHHLNSVPLIYLEHGFSLKEVLLHLALLHEASNFQEGIPALHLDVKDMDVDMDHVSDDSGSRSSFASVSLSGSSFDNLSDLIRVEITFAFNCHVCRCKLAASFSRTSMKLSSLMICDLNYGFSLGIASLQCFKSEFSKQQLVDHLASVGKSCLGLSSFVPKSPGIGIHSNASMLSSPSLTPDVSGGNVEPPESITDVVISAVPSHCESKEAKMEGLLQLLLSERGAMKEKLGDYMLDPTKLKIGSILAVGASGEVRKGEYDGRDVAIKILKGEHKEAHTMAEFRREVLALMSCGQCEHLLKFYGFCVDMRQRMCIVTKFMAGGTVYELLRRRKNEGLPLRQVLQIAKDVALGMQFLHHHGMIHRDLKSANILLDLDGSAVIGDFGVARLKGERGEMTKEVGTYRWMAPEAFGTGAWTVTFKSDVYSFAIVLWELVTGQLPYADYSPIQAAVAVALNGLRPAIPDTCLPSLRILIEACWEKNPLERPDFDQVLTMIDSIMAETYMR